MRRRSRYLVFALFLLILFTVQTIQADLSRTNDAHMDNNTDWANWIGGGAKERTCKPCHAYWNLTVWSGAGSYYDVDSLVVNTPSRILDNCVDCHTYGYPDMSMNIDPNLPTALASSVHGSLEKKCLSCHTIYHSGHQTVREETVNGDVYKTCDSGCHQIAANLDDSNAGYAVTAGDYAWMRIYAANSTVIPTTKPVFPSSTSTTTTSYYPTSYNLVKGTLSSGSVSNLTSNDGVYMTIQSAAYGSETELTIQPSDADALVDQWNPDTNYGTDTYIGTYSRNGRLQRSFISFDVSSIPNGVSIDSAILSLYLYSGAGTGRTLDIHNVTSSWLEGDVTWNTQPTVAASPIDSQTVLGSNGWMNWTVTSLVSAWYAGGTNNGFGIIDANEDSGRDQVLFYSKEYAGDTSLRPRLVVTYVDAQGYSVVVEFTGTSNSNTFTQLVWSIDSALTTGSVPVILQLYNYNSGGYPTSGDGYISYASSATPNTDETKTQTISTNPSNFKDSSGNWKIRVNATLGSPTQFDLKVDWVEYKPTYYLPVEAFIRKLFNSSSASPFGEQKQNMYNAYVDPWNKDPSLIASTERYKTCLNCHFITTNPAEAKVISDSSGTKYIPIPEEVFSLIGDAHSIGSLKDYNLDGEDIGVEKRSSDVQITYILPLVTVAIIVLILVTSRRSTT